MHPAELVIDACSLINLYATEQEVLVLKTIQVRLVTTPQAAGEVLYRYGPIDNEGQRVKLPISLKGLISAKLLKIVPLDDGLTDYLVNAVTAGLRDADASVVALAQGLGHPLASDDNKVRKISARLIPAPPLESTLGLLRRMAETVGYTSRQIKALIAQLAWSGNFIIPKTDPNRAWYEAHGAG